MPYSPNSAPPCPDPSRRHFGRYRAQRGGPTCPNVREHRRQILREGRTQRHIAIVGQLGDDQCRPGHHCMVQCLGKFRGCDLVALRVRDVSAAGHVKERASMIQSKTGKPVRFEITEITRLSLERWIRDPEMIGREFFWPSRVHGSPHLSIRQYARIVRGWVMSLGLDPSSCGTHSMRRTKVAQICKRTGNLRAVQLLLGHTKMDSTVRYLGVDIEDALSLSEGIDL
jgi:integrase